MYGALRGEHTTSDECFDGPPRYRRFLIDRGVLHHVSYGDWVQRKQPRLPLDDGQFNVRTAVQYVKYRPDGCRVGARFYLVLGRISREGWETMQN